MKGEEWGCKGQNYAEKKFEKKNWTSSKKLKTSSFVSEFSMQRKRNKFFILYITCVLNIDTDLLRKLNKIKLDSAKRNLSNKCKYSNAIEKENNKESFFMWLIQYFMHREITIWRILSSSFSSAPCRTQWKTSLKVEINFCILCT